MRYIVFGLLALLIAIQYPLWIGKGGWLHLYQLDRDVSTQAEKNKVLEQRNAKIAGDVENLKQGTMAVEERARIEHGMVKDGETMVQMVQGDEPLPKAKSAKPKADEAPTSEKNHSESHSKASKSTQKSPASETKQEKITQ